MRKKDDRIATLGVMLNQTMEGRHVEIIAYEDL